MLKSYYIDHHLSLEAFNIPRIALIIKRGKRLFCKQKAMHLPIKKDILKRITISELINIVKLNINMAFKVAWAGFQGLEEITYTSTECKKAFFSKTKVRRSDVSFVEGNQYAVLWLKQSKTDTEHTGIQIILAATGEKTYSVATLAHLYTLDPQPPAAPLLHLSSGAFSCFSIVSALEKLILLAGLAQSDYSGHSFCKSAAQYAADPSMLDEIIQKLD